MLSSVGRYRNPARTTWVVQTCLPVSFYLAPLYLTALANRRRKIRSSSSARSRVQMRLRSEPSERSAILYYVSDTNLVIIQFWSDSFQIYSTNKKENTEEANETRSASHLAETLQRLVFHDKIPLYVSSSLKFICIFVILQRSCQYFSDDSEAYLEQRIVSVKWI